MAVVRGMLPWIVAYSSPFELEIGARVLGFTFALACVVGCVLGLVPASELVRHRGSPLLPGRARDDSVGHERFRRALVLGQVALSMTLLAMSGMLLRSFVALVQVDPGYDHERLALAEVGLSPADYPEPESRAAFVDALEEHLQGVPGVEAVSYSSGLGFRSGVPLEAEGEPVRVDQPYRIPYTTVAIDYVETTGTELLAGRGFVVADVETGGVIIDGDMARFLWRNERPIGRRFRLGEDGAWMTVVGVVRELRLMGRDQREGPYQILRPATPEGVGSWVQVAVRVAGDPRTVLPDIRRAVRAVDPQQTIWRLRSASDALAEAEEVPRFVVSLIGALAGIAVLLALLGLYGVMSYSVSRRRRELGVRIALGADRGRVRRMVLSDGVVLALGGVGIGVASTLLVASTFEHLLYEVSPRDPVTLALASALFIVTAGVAALAPAHRATAVDPIEALRAE
jgi:predicted permease